MPATRHSGIGPDSLPLLQEIKFNERNSQMPSFRHESKDMSFEGPRGRPEGVNGSRLKFLTIGKIGIVPKFIPNPRVLGTVWSSYEEATPTQENPRNKRKPTRKQTPKNSARINPRYTHRLNRRALGQLVGLTDAQSLQQ